MSQRQGGWRSARAVAPSPHTRHAVVATAPQPALAVASDSARQRLGRLAAAALEPRWSVSFVALLAYVASAVTYRVSLVAPAVVAALIGLVMEKGRVSFPPFLALFVGFIAWTAVGFSGSMAPKATSDEIVVLIKIAVIVFAMTSVIRTSWRARIFAIFFLACFGAFPARGTLQNYFLAGYTRFGRALWNFIYANSNDLAALTFFPLSLCVAVALTEKKGWVRYAALAGCGVLPLIILLTQSRAALIGLVVATLLFFILHSTGKRMRTLLTAAALAALTLPFVPSSAWERFGGLKMLTNSETIVYADPEGSAESRYAIWSVARAITKDYPITGVGLGAYTTAHERYAESMSIAPAAKGRRDTHSMYLNLSAETGLVGLAIFVAMIGVTIVDAETTRRRVKGSPRSQQLLALELGLVAFLVASIFGSYSKLAFLYIQLGFLWVTTNLAKQELVGVASVPGGRAGAAQAAWRGSR